MSTKTIRFTDSDGNLHLPESAESGSNYVKFADGTLIQWGSYSYTAGYGSITLTFIAFVDTNYVLLITPIGSGANSNVNVIPWYEKTTTTQTVIARKTDASTVSTNVDFNWLAIGRWK